MNSFVFTLTQLKMTLFYPNHILHPLLFFWSTLPCIFFVSILHHRRPLYPVIKAAHVFEPSVLSVYFVWNLCQLPALSSPSSHFIILPISAIEPPENTKSISHFGGRRSDLFYNFFLCFLFSACHVTDLFLLYMSTIPQKYNYKKFYWKKIILIINKYFLYH